MIGCENMAKKQNKNAKNRQKAKQTKLQAKKPAVSPVKGKREPSKGEIKFFRIGVAIIALGLVVAAIVIIVNNYMTQEEVNPYEDYNHLQTEELVAITKENDTTYGDLDYFIGKSQYEDLRVILNQYDVFYFYFYHSDDINQDIKAQIDMMDDVVDSALLFIDLDKFKDYLSKYKKTERSLLEPRGYSINDDFNKIIADFQKELEQVQGINRTWFCGAWTGYGFHEDGLSSGLHVAEKLGGVIPWRPTAANDEHAFIEAAE